MWDATSGGNQIQSITLEQSGGAPTNRIQSVSASRTTNVALTTNGATATASSTYSGGGSYPASGAKNGDRKGVNWGDDVWAAAAMDYLSYAEPSEAIQLFRNGLRDPRPVLRAHACSEVGQRDIRELKEDVRRLLKDEDQYVRNAAQAANELLDLGSLATPNS